MIGVFLKNKDGMLCFVQPLQDEMPEIAAFRYSAETHFVAITLASGHEENITMPIALEMRDAFLKEKSVLVVNLDEKGEFQREYKVPLVS